MQVGSQNVLQTLNQQQGSNSYRDFGQNQSPPGALTSWVYRPQRETGEPNSTGQHESSGATKHFRSVASTERLPHVSCDVSPTQLHQLDLTVASSSKTSATDRQNVEDLPFNAHARENLFEKSSSRAEADLGLGTVLPSTDEAGFHSIISKLRTALSKQETNYSCLQQQLMDLQQKYHTCECEKTQLEREICCRQQNAELGFSANDGKRQISMFSAEAGSHLVEIRVERDVAKLQVEALRKQLEAAEKIHIEVGVTDLMEVNKLIFLSNMPLTSLS